MINLNKLYFFDAIILWLLVVISSLLLIFVSGSALTSNTAMHYQFAMRSFKFTFVIVFAYCLQYAVHKRLFCKDHVFILINSIFWVIASPVIIAQELPSLTADATFGITIFLSLISIQAIVCSLQKQYIYILFACCFCGLILLGSVELIHFLLFKGPVSNNSITAVLQTDFHEAIEWIIIKVDVLGILLTVFLLISLFLAVLHVSKAAEYRIKNKVMLSVIVFITLIISFGYLLPRTHVVSMIIDEINYNNTLKDYSRNRNENIGHLQFFGNQSIKPRTVCLIIGESASSDFMKIYNESYKYDNTPWMKSLLTNANKNTILIRNSYASYNLTVISVPRILTTMSQYNSDKFENCISLLDVAQKAGYKVYWLSNQSVGTGRWDASISILANTADYVIEAKDEDGKKSAYDDRLINDLEKINPDENNLIVIHLKGSHAKYDMRYPSNMTEFDDSLEGKYATSILYTDSVLKKIYEVGKNKLNMDIMLYTSDHGEDMEWQHGTKQLWNNYHVPCMIWVSDTYKQYFSSQYENLQNNRDRAFSNDMIYNTLCGMMNLKSNYYNSDEDYSSKHYMYDRNNIRVVSGKHYAIEDNGSRYIEE